jgi:hypothetical protein
MRVAGYIRESQDPDEMRPAFAQQEEIRRWAGAEAHSLIAICQDVLHPGRPLGHEGYLSLLGVVDGGRVEAVVVPGLETLSADHVVQEIMLWDLRSRGVAVFSTREPESVIITGETPGPTRMFIRDVLERVSEYARSAGSRPLTGPGEAEVIVQLLPAAVGVEPDPLSGSE